MIPVKSHQCLTGFVLQLGSASESVPKSCFRAKFLNVGNYIMYACWLRNFGKSTILKAVQVEEHSSGAWRSMNVTLIKLFTAATSVKELQTRTTFLLLCIRKDLPERKLELLHSCSIAKPQFSKNQFGGLGCNRPDLAQIIPLKKKEKGKKNPLHPK